MNEKSKPSKEQVCRWHEEGLNAAATYHKSEFRMVETLIFMDESKGFLLYESASLTAYAMKHWKLSEYAARDLVTVANKSNEVPAILDVLRTKKSTISKLRKICPVITLETQAEWLDVACRCTSREIQKAVACEMPELELTSSMKYVSGNLVDMSARIPEELAESLRYIQDLASQKSRKPATLNGALKVMAELTLEKLDPVRRAERAAKRKERGAEKAATDRNSSDNVQPERAESEESIFTRECNEEIHFAESNLDRMNLEENTRDGNTSQDIPLVSRRVPRARVSLPSDAKHEVDLRDQNRCTHVDESNHRCESRRWLEYHHIVPVSEGGTNDPNNLRTTCWQHHRAHHHEWGSTWSLNDLH